MCQGSRSTLCLVDGSVPPVLHDLTIARVEKWLYHDSSDNLTTPQKESISMHHCCCVSCIKGVELLLILFCQL